jgi:hypothetical protein
MIKFLFFLFLRNISMDSYLWIIIILILILLIFLLSRRHKKENYSIANDKLSEDLFNKLTIDLEKLYPNIHELDLNGLVSCIPEDSYTENKTHVSICLRNREGKYYTYEKLLKIGIHELAHVMSKGFDPEHKTPEFINNYSSLMRKAKELGYNVE